MDDHEEVEEALEAFRRTLPPLRRTYYPPLYADPLVSVQPLGDPAGLRYYLKWKKENQKKTDWEKEGF